MKKNLSVILTALVLSGLFPLIALAVDCPGHQQEPFVFVEATEEFIPEVFVEATEESIPEKESGHPTMVAMAFLTVFVGGAIGLRNSSNNPPGR